MIMYSGKIPDTYETFQEGSTRIERTYERRMKLLGAGCASLLGASAAFLLWEPSSLDDVVGSFSLWDLGTAGLMFTTVGYVMSYALLSRLRDRAMNTLEASTLETHLTRNSSRHIMRKDF